MSLDWAKLAWAVVPTLVGWAIVAFTPLADGFIRNSLKRSAPWVKEMLNKMYAEERKANALTRTQVAANTDALEFIRASVIAQGQELPKMSLAVNELTVAVKSMTHAVESVQEIATLARESNIRLEAQVQNWERQRREDIERSGGVLRRKSDYTTPE